MFGRGWKPGQATIVTRRLVGDGHGGYEYTADVRADDGLTAFRATIREPSGADHLRSPDVGEVVRVTLRESDEHVRFDGDDPVLREAPPAPDLPAATAPTEAEVRAAALAFQAASERASAVFQGFIQSRKSGDKAGIARAKAEMPAANTEVQRCNAEIQRLERARVEQDR
jgi:hypothetical protein